MESAAQVLGVIGGVLGGAAAFYSAIRYKDIEAFRTEQANAAFKYQTRFSRLHETHIETIGELYRLLMGVERSFASWTHPLQLAEEPTPDEKMAAATDAANAFQDYFIPNRIWFTQELAQSIQEFNATIHRIHSEFASKDDQSTREKMKIWREASRSTTEELPALRKKIEAEFRTLLAVGAD